MFSNSSNLSVNKAPTPLVYPDSYHPSLIIELQLYSNPIHNFQRTYLDFKSGDYLSITQFDFFSWEITFSKYSINDAATVFNDALLNSIKKMYP